MIKIFISHIAKKSIFILYTDMLLPINITRVYQKPLHSFEKRSFDNPKNDYQNNKICDDLACLASRNIIFKSNKSETIDFSELKKLTENTPLKTRPAIFELNKKESEFLKTTLAESLNTTFENLKCSKQVNSIHTYNFPLKLALAVRNETLDKKNAEIINIIPKMFQNINKNELFAKLDLLSAGIREEKYTDKTYIMNIQNKMFKLDYIKSGLFGHVYKITDDKNDYCIMKTFIYPQSNWLKNLSEMKTAYESSKSDVNNVPMFFFANPSFKEYKTNKSRNKSTGCWQITEFITSQTPVKNNDQTFLDWLYKNNLFWDDKHKDNQIGNYVVDLGMVYPDCNYYVSALANTKIIENLISDENISAKYILDNYSKFIKET